MVLSSKSRQYIIASCAAGLIFTLDQYLKSNSAGSILNPGIFLGLWLPSLGLIIVHASVVLGGILILPRRDYVAGQVWLWLGMLVSISNLVDRLRLGAVIDYWQLGGVWFNLADLVITISLSLVMAVNMGVIKRKK